ncbi:MAG TPA: dUTP diphosphatase [Thermodesulfovibrio thiophilus]|nr:dUTP diphosphatase [Thermodesulfovibrio thiophilus]HQD37270.1 dUTP diphosphatase [Thermodesulfovibrio thiophilus]
MQVKVKKLPNYNQEVLPDYATAGSSGVDLFYVGDSITLHPMERRLFKTGLVIEIPDGYEAQIRPRSGLALKHGITVLNTPATIDSDYRGEIGVILINLSNESFVVKTGMRIAQMVFCPVERVTFVETGSLDDTERGFGGFGSTGL